MLDARAIARKQLGGFAIAEVMKPTRGLRDEITRKGGKPKDHAKENKKRLKELEETNRRKKEEEAKPSSPLWKMKRFESVPARIETRSNSNSRTPSDGARSRSLSFDGGMDADYHPPGAFLSPPTNDPPRSVNFIARNIRKSEGAASRVAEPSPIREFKRSTKMGEIPQYLVNRKSEWADREQQRLAALKSDAPPGMIRVSDQERMDTLRFLKTSQTDLLDELSHMPIAVTSLSIKRRKKEIDDKLSEIEKGISLFSQSAVYTKKT